MELALSGVTGAGDLGKQSFPLTGADNPVSNKNITGFFFEPSLVRSVYARYYVYRQTDSTKAIEAGTFTMVYNPDNSPGSKWEVSRQYVQDAQVAFTMTDAGQMQISTTAISGSNHIGNVAFVAQVLIQES